MKLLREVADVRRTMDLWRNMAVRAGLKGLHLVGVCSNAQWNPQEFGFDASTIQSLPVPRPWVSKGRPLEWLRRKYHEKANLPTIYRFEEAIPDLMPVRVDAFPSYPTLIHAWDNSPRSGSNAVVLRDSTPELFRALLRRAIEVRADKPRDEQIIFVKAWNEWAEGNHLEPDLKDGKSYLEVIEQEVCDR